ncbi:MAG: hypothetical protein WCD18_06580 [Thermosynechococcaceae cyanobacterium]
MEKQTDRAYRLTWEFDHMEFYDGECEIELHEFPGWEKTNGFYKTTLYNLPDPIVFEADFEALTRTDYPISNVGWPIMSRRMYYTLLMVGDFPHRVFPVAMVDDTSFIFESERRFLADGKPNPEVTNFDDFVSIQILEDSDYFDFEHSAYEASSDFPEWVTSVERYVLNEPSQGFPPLFRLAADSVVLFISAKAREALRESGIRGTAYYALDDGFSFQGEVDIPVEVPTYP